MFAIVVILKLKDISLSACLLIFYLHQLQFFLVNGSIQVRMILVGQSVDFYAHFYL